MFHNLNLEGFFTDEFSYATTVTNRYLIGVRQMALPNILDQGQRIMITYKNIILPKKHYPVMVFQSSGHGRLNGRYAPDACKSPTEMPYFQLEIDPII